MLPGATHPILYHFIDTLMNFVEIFFVDIFVDR